ncbi:MAG: toprim domain-containing protein [Porticoccaceae bacterium]
MADPVMLFADALQAVYGALDFTPVPDGQIHRFKVPSDRTGSRNGWYVLYLDGIASGAFGSWKIGGTQTWSAREPANPHEADQLRRRIDTARRQREAEQWQRQEKAANRARCAWSDTTPADPRHPYLIRKSIKPHGLRQAGDVLLVPLYAGERLVNLQRILPDGSKRFLAGGRVKGAYSSIGLMEPGQTLYVCEGWATGATIHEETGDPVACAMNAGNLLNVGRALSRGYPDNPIVIAGDDDRQTEGNPGKTAAIKAAAALGCGLVMPPWPKDAPPDLTDFNDLACWRARA